MGTHGPEGRATSILKLLAGRARCLQYLTGGGTFPSDVGHARTGRYKRAAARLDRAARRLERVEVPAAGAAKAAGAGARRPVAAADRRSGRAILQGGGGAGSVARHDTD